MRAFEEAVHISRREEDHIALYRALTYLCMQLYFQGKFQAACPLAEEGATVARDLFDSSYELLCLGFLCQAHWSLGDYGKALTVAYEVLTKSQARARFLSEPHQEYLGLVSS